LKKNKIKTKTISIYFFLEKIKKMASLIPFEFGANYFCLEKPLFEKILTILNKNKNLFKIPDIVREETRTKIDFEKFQNFFVINKNTGSAKIRDGILTEYMKIQSQWNGQQIHFINLKTKQKFIANYYSMNR